MYLNFLTNLRYTPERDTLELWPTHLSSHMMTAEWIAVVDLVSSQGNCSGLYNMGLGSLVGSPQVYDSRNFGNFSLKNIPSTDAIRVLMRC